MNELLEVMSSIVLLLTLLNSNHQVSLDSSVAFQQYHATNDRNGLKASPTFSNSFSLSCIFPVVAVIKIICKARSSRNTIIKTTDADMIELSDK